MLLQCNGDYKQQWYSSSGWWGSDGYHTVFQGKNNVCLDVYHSNFVAGQWLQLWQYNGTNAQNWIVFSDGTIRPAANTSLCVDV